MPARSSRLPAVRPRVAGPVIALVVLVVAFGIGSSSFLTVGNLSLVVQQALVVGTLALGQALIVLIAGVDLACAAVAVFATLLVAKLATTGTPGPVALLVGILAAAAIAADWRMDSCRAFSAFVLGSRFALGAHEGITGKPVQIRRGAAAVIGQARGSSATGATLREGDPRAARSREPEDLPVACSFPTSARAGRKDVR